MSTDWPHRDQARLRTRGGLAGRREREWIEGMPRCQRWSGLKVRQDGVEQKAPVLNGKVKLGFYLTENGEPLGVFSWCELELCGESREEDEAP